MVKVIAIGTSILAVASLASAFVLKGMNMADKIRRVEERRLRTETNKESRNSKEYYNY